MNVKYFPLMKHNLHNARGTPLEHAAASALSSQLFHHKKGVSMRRLWNTTSRRIGSGLVVLVLTLVGLAAPAAADQVPYSASSTTVVLLGAAGAAPSTAEQQPLLVCHGTRTITYQPGITYAEVAHQVDIDTIYTSCRVLGDPSLTSGHADPPVSFTRVEGCNTRRNPSDGVRYDIIHWNNGQSSTLATTYVVDRVNGSLSIKQTGTVIDGFGLGAHVTQMVTAPADPVACASELGLTSQQAQVRLTLTPAS